MRIVDGDHLVSGKIYYLMGSPECLMKFIHVKINRRTYNRSPRFHFFSGEDIFMHSNDDTIGFCLLEHVRFVEVNLFRYGK